MQPTVSSKAFLGFTSPFERYFDCSSPDYISSRAVNLPYAKEFYKNFGVFYCMDRTLRVKNHPYAQVLWRKLHVAADGWLVGS